MYERLYNFALKTLSQLGTFAIEVYEWLTEPRDFGGTELTIVELIIGNGVILLLAFLLAKIIVNIVV